MKPIYELISQFKKKTFGHKTNETPISHIAEFQDDVPSLWSRQMELSEKPHISFKITQEEIYNDLNEGRE